VVASVAVTLFWGGWLRPFPNVAWLEYPLNFGFPALLLVGSGIASFPLVRGLKSDVQKIILIAAAVFLLFAGALFLIPAVNAAVIGMFWFLLKVGIIIYLMIWFRGTFPRFRYDQLMNIGWKYMIPIGMGAILVNAVAGMLKAR
jgi:NADH-quinone oxidoreductase subunit H